MCKTGKNIKFCTCIVDGNSDPIIHHKKSKRNKKEPPLNSDTIYKWTLYKYSGLEESTMEGLLFEPSDKLGEYLTNETLLLGLNTENCFDFEFIPSEGDNLVVYDSQKPSSCFLSFIYKSGHWNADSYDCFIHKIEKINHGKVVVE